MAKSDGGAKSDGTTGPTGHRGPATPTGSFHPTGSKGGSRSSQPSPSSSLLSPVLRVSEASDFLASLKPGVAHAVVTDPPAGFGYQSREWDGDKKEREEKFIEEFREVLGSVGAVWPEGPPGRGEGAPSGPGGLGDRRALALLRRWLPNPWTLWFRDIADGFRRVLVPGGWALVWSTPKTRHWAAMGLELAGFEVWDDIAWLYGTGMPKNTNVAWLVDREEGFPRKSSEPPVSRAAREAASRGSAFCPSREDFILARKPLDGTYARSWLDWRSGTLDIDGLRFSEDARWPKNTIVSPEVSAALGAMSRYFYVQKVRTGSHETEAGLEDLPVQAGHDMVKRKAGTDGLTNGRAGRGRSGSGAKNHHPTVKPLELCRLLVRAVTLPGQVVVDPFCGSGSIPIAAMQEGRRAVGADMNPEYVEISKCRAAYWKEQPVPHLDPKKPGGILPAPGRGGPTGPTGSSKRCSAGSNENHPTGPTRKSESLSSSSKIIPVRLPANVMMALEEWSYPISHTIVAALDSYFGIYQVREGRTAPHDPVIPAGYLDGFERAGTPGAPTDLSLPASLISFLRREDQARRDVGVKGAAVATIRRALCLWLGVRETDEDREKAIPRHRMRLEYIGD